MTRTFSCASCSFFSRADAVPDLLFCLMSNPGYQNPAQCITDSLSHLQGNWLHVELHRKFVFINQEGEESFQISQNKFHLLASCTIKSHGHGSRLQLPCTSVHYLCVGLHIYCVIDWRHDRHEPLSEQAMSLHITTSAKLMEYNVVS